MIATIAFVLGAVFSNILWLAYFGKLYGGKLIKTSDEDGLYLSAAIEDQTYLEQKFILLRVVESDA